MRFLGGVRFRIGWPSTSAGHHARNLGIIFCVRGFLQKSIRSYGNSNVALHRSGKMGCCIHEIDKREFGGGQFRLSFDLLNRKMLRVLEVKRSGGSGVSKITMGCG